MDVPGFALITGAASGMGRECAKKFAQDGAAGVALVDFDSDGLGQVKDEVIPMSRIPGFKVVTHQVDVSDEGQIDSVVKSVAETFGRLDYVVNAAGVGFKHDGGGALAETKDWKRVLEINLDGTFFVLRAAARIMLKQDPIRSCIDGRELQKGSIVNFASVAGLIGIASSTAYCASKAAVIGLTRSMSEDYAKQGLRINALCPGYVNTPFLQKSPAIAAVVEEKAKVWTPMGRLAEPKELADAVIFLSGGRSSYVTGSAMVVDGGYTER